MSAASTNGETSGAKRSFRRARPAVWTTEDSRFSRASEGRSAVEAARFLGVSESEYRSWYKRWRSRGVQP